MTTHSLGQGSFRCKRVWLHIGRKQCCRICSNANSPNIFVISASLLYVITKTSGAIGRSCRFGTCLRRPNTVFAYSIVWVRRQGFGAGGSNFCFSSSGFANSAGEMGPVVVHPEGDAPERREAEPSCREWTGICGEGTCGLGLPAKNGSAKIHRMSAVVNKVTKSKDCPQWRFWK